MDIDKLLDLLKSRIGFVESKHRDEVIKGARIAFSIMHEEKEDFSRPLKSAEKEIDKLRSQLKFISGVIKEHGDFE